MRKLNGKRKYSHTASAIISAGNDGGDRAGHERWSSRIVRHRYDRQVKVTVPSDVVGFHGSSVVDLKNAFHEAVDDYIETCTRVGKDPQKTIFWKNHVPGNA
jgi:hypothetical protein